MRNSVNVGLGAGGAMVETGHNTDSRPSSTESCKSNPSTNDSMNYKDILVQFAKMSQQGNVHFLEFSTYFIIYFINCELYLIRNNSPNVIRFITLR